ncbi:MAG: glycine betaine ABC transporter substrate-binding protein [Bacillota bacterium]
MKKILSLLLLALIVLTVQACGDDEDTIVIASKPMTEQYILVEMLTLLIEDNTDLTVDQQLGIGGGTSNIHPGMISGEIDMYPEYTGTGWLFVLEEELITDPDELYTQVKAAYLEELDIVWTEQYGFNNTFGLAVTQTLVDEHNLETYSDLAAISSDLTLGAEYDFYEREDGYPGLQETYGFDFGTTTELDIGLKYQAIDSDQVDVINIFSTDGRLEEYNLKVLEDDLNFFPPYYAATLVREEILDEYPELEAVLAMMDGLISNEDMTYMNYRVEINNDDPKVVAREFLEEKDLLE